VPSEFYASRAFLAGENDWFEHANCACDGRVGASGDGLACLFSSVRIPEELRVRSANMLILNEFRLRPAVQGKTHPGAEVAF
jgi:hypothetical protein